MAETIERSPGRVQGVLLVSLGVLAVAAIILLAPSMPKMQAYFGGAASAQLVTFSLTCPALCVALLSPFAGMWIDRFGRRVPLLFSLLLYAIMGTAPLYLDSLPLIIVSRLGVGVAETILLAASITLLSDYFQGQQRERYLALNTGITSVAATLLFALGGVLGDMGWRTPFVVYLVAPVLFVCVYIWTWEPVKRSTDNVLEPSVAELVSASIPWVSMTALLLVTVAGGIVFFVPQILIGVIMGAHGFTSASTVGMVGAVGAVAAPLGALAFAVARKRGVTMPLLVTFAFVAEGVGLFELASQTTLSSLTTSLALHQFGGGMMIPGLTAWTLGLLPPHSRGKGTGIFYSAFFISQPLCGVLFEVATKSYGGQSLSAVRLFGYFSIWVAVLVMIRIVQKSAMRRDPYIAN